MTTNIENRTILWVCCACGKRSNDRYGKNPIDLGWDESCFMNSIQAYEDMLVVSEGRVIEIKDGGIIPEAS